MRRFTDPILFGVLAVATALVWLVSSLAHSIPEVPQGYLAPMTVVVFCIIATPALATVAVAGLFRALARANPKTFWGSSALGTVIATIFVYIAGVVTQAQSLQVGFGATSWFTRVAAGASVIAFVLALTGAIPAGPDDAPASTTPRATPVAVEETVVERQAPSPVPVSREEVPAPITPLRSDVDSPAVEETISFDDVTLEETTD